MKSNQLSLERVHMEQLNLITNFLRIKDKNITITDEYDMGTHLELHGPWTTQPLNAQNAKGQMAKYDYQKTSKIPLPRNSWLSLTYPS